MPTSNHLRRFFLIFPQNIYYFLHAIDTRAIEKNFHRHISKNNSLFSQGIRSPGKSEINSIGSKIDILLCEVIDLSEITVWKIPFCEMWIIAVSVRNYDSHNQYARHSGKLSNVLEFIISLVQIVSFNRRLIQSFCFRCSALGIVRQCSKYSKDMKF